jgi:hypothetical protein
MRSKLYFFRLGKDGGIVVTTDSRGSRLPIDKSLDYKLSDWNFLEAVPRVDLPKMIMSVPEAEAALAGHGYYSLSSREVLRGHPFFQRHPA